jgi:D-3-phosphoglycerate dehydrogenase / 2-oxoglutarate reductase
VSLPKLLISECDRFTEAAANRLREFADVQLADLDRPQLLRAVHDVEVLWIRLRHEIDRELFAAAPQLRFLCSPTTGLNHIDLEEADRRGVRVISLRGEVDFLREIRATAEHTVGLMLSLLRHLPSAIEHVRQGGWDRDLFCGHELHNKTIGIVGYGRLGKLVAKYVSAFDARVLVSDPNVDASGDSTVQQVSLEKLLVESDIVTLHVNLCDQTIGFFDAKAFQRMRSGSWLATLQSGKLSGAALDVLWDERSDGMPNHALVKYASQQDHLIITPHIGGCTTESMAKTETFLTEKLCAALQESSVKA